LSLYKSSVKSVLCFVFIFSFTACSNNYFFCSNKEQSYSFRFFYTNQKVILNDIYDYYDYRVYLPFDFIMGTDNVDIKTKNLTIDDKPGSYYLKIGDQNITLQIIQKIVHVENKSYPNHSLEEDSSSHKDFLNQIRYHSVFKHIEEYNFNKESLSLIKSSKALYPPVSAIKQSFHYGEGGRFYPKKVKDLSLKEVSQIFPASTLNSSQTLQCTKKSVGIFKKIMRFIISLIHYI